MALRAAFCLQWRFFRFGGWFFRNDFVGPTSAAGLRGLESGDDEGSPCDFRRATRVECHLEMMAQSIGKQFGIGLRGFFHGLK